MRVEATACGPSDPAYHGVLDTLVQWSLDDPPDSDERRRNQQVWCKQENRNPFVDHPEWVDCLYNGNCNPDAPAFGGLNSASDLDLCAATGVQLTWTVPYTWNDDCTSNCDRGFRVFRDDVLVTGGGCADPLDPAATGCVDDNGAVNTLYTYRVEAFNDLGNTADGGVTAQAGDFTDDTTAPQITSGPTATPSRTSFNAAWETDEPANGTLEWGTTQGGPYPDSTSHSGLASSHLLTADGLTVNTAYYDRVCSTDGCGNGPTCSTEDSTTTVSSCDPGDDTPVFVNEVHYDNVSTDQDEGVEIAGPAGTDLSDYAIEFHTGNGGSTYATVSLSGTIDDEGDGYGAVWFDIAGIQNGAPDGFALIYDSSEVVQFLCYEGTFMATDGVANGMVCTDIVVDEDPPPATGLSLQLTGGPTFVYEEFSWIGPTARSPDVLNTAVGQVMECDDGDPIFSNGFETGDTTGWSKTVP
jgi:hypothetical protein